MLQINSVDEDYTKYLENISSLLEYMEAYLRDNYATLNFKSFIKEIICLEKTPSINRDIRFMVAHDADYFNCKIIGGIDKKGKTVTDDVNVLFDVRKMQAVSIVGKNIITGLRTAAINGIAIKHLQPPNMNSVLIISCGFQALYHIPVISSLNPDVKIYIYDKEKKKNE